MPQKCLKVKKLREATEFHPGGFLFTIFDDDGKTILKEYWDCYEKLGIQYCRNWLAINYGNGIDLSAYDSLKKD
jgi:hypothetical protein